MMFMHKKILILVENLSVPFDRRVWLEAITLQKAGYGVLVICPASKFDPESYIKIDGVRIYRYLLPETGPGIIDHIREYAVAMLRTLFLTFKVFVKHRFQAIHACNPPDLFFIIGLIFKLFGTKFVFDQHDLCPETFMVQQHGKKGNMYRLLLLTEWLTYRTCDMVLATNESVKKIAIERGGLDDAHAVVVRTGPDLNRFRLQEPCIELKKNRKYMVVYLGVMGAQDGVDYAIRAINYLVKEAGRNDTCFVFIGAGDVFDKMILFRDELGLAADTVSFTGRIPDDEVLKYLATADVCIAPDPKNGLNEFHTMNKTLEYMAMGKAQVCFDLEEMRVSAGEAALYAEANDVKDFGNKIAALLDNPEKRDKMGRIGYNKIKDQLSWAYSSKKLLTAYERLFSNLCQDRYAG